MLLENYNAISVQRKNFQYEVISYVFSYVFLCCLKCQDAFQFRILLRAMKCFSVAGIQKQEKNNVSNIDLAWRGKGLGYQCDRYDSVWPGYSRYRNFYDRIRY